MHEELVVERIQVGAREGVYLPSVLADDDAPRTVRSCEEVRERLETLPEDVHSLLVFDQFEELITLFEHEGEEALCAQRRVVDLLVDILRNDTLPLKVLLAFRDDYLAKVKALLAACPELVDQSLHLTLPQRDVLPDIILGPFTRFSGHWEREISPELAEQLEAAIDVRSDTGTVNLSEVQIVCRRLWQDDEPSALLEDVGVQGILEGFLSEALSEFPLDLRYPATALLGEMITSAGTRNVVTADDLIARVQKENNIPAKRLLEALDALESKTKLIHAERRRDLYLYEVTSEFLLPWIRARREDVVRSQERQRIRRRVLMAAIALIVLVVLAVALWTYRSWHDGRPWASLTNVATGVTSGLTGREAFVGRNVANYPQNQVAVGPLDRDVSRLHVSIEPDLDMVDLRSLNGTTVNARFLPYGQTKSLHGGDLVALAGAALYRIEPLHYSGVPFVDASFRDAAPAPGWGIFVDGDARATTPLTRSTYYVAVRGDRLALTTASTPDAIATIERDGSEVIVGKGGRGVLGVQFKKSDYEYPSQEFRRDDIVRCGPCGMTFDAGGHPFQIVMSGVS
jgi:hypothetical protein